MATRAPRRARSRPNSGAASRNRRAVSEKGGAEGAADFEEITARAARLGVTPQKVLREYARIAFADLRHIVEWGEGGVHVKDHLSAAEAAPISEISTGSAGKGPVRVKLYDKKAALDAIARYLGMFSSAPKRPEPDEPADTAEDAREELARLVARLAPGASAT